MMQQPGYQMPVQQQPFGNFSQPMGGLQAPNIMNGFTAGPNAGGLQTTGILPGFN